MKAVARREIEAEAQAMVAEMRLGAPRDEGDLEQSIQAEDVSGDYEASIRWRVTAGGPLTRRAVRRSKKGNAPLYDYAFAIEYGYIGADGEHVEAQPFFWPVKRRRVKRFRRKLMRELRKAAAEP
jgi:hypothetical protein